MVLSQHLYVAECILCMTLLTLAAKAAIMDIVIRMAADTQRPGFTGIGSRLMTGMAVQVCMRVLQFEICFQIVVKIPAIPGIGVVAVIALFAKCFFMNIVLSMA